MDKVKQLLTNLIKLRNKIQYKKDIILQTEQSKSFTKETIEEYNEKRKYGYQKYLCNAPFVSMYFGLQGDISVCCLNRTYLLGNIQSNTVDSCWNSEKIKTLRTSIATQTFDFGCQHCKNQIIAKNYSNLVANEYDGYYSDKITHPQVITFELENTCNLACVFCSGTFSSTFNKHFDRLPAKPPIYGEDFITQIKPYLIHLKKANFLGGEPFLIESYLTIIEFLIEHNPSCEIHIQTNGHIFNNRVINILKKGNIYIGISVESINKTKFNEIRKFGNWDKLVANIEQFKKYAPHKKINLSVTPIQDSVTELIEILLFANKHNLELFFNILYSPYKYALWSMNSSRLMTIKNELHTTIFPLNTSLEKSNYNNYVSFLNIMESWAKQAEIRKKNELIDSNVAIKEIIKRITTHIDCIAIYDDETKKQILSKLLKKLEDKIENNPLLYTKIYNDLLSMDDDVIFGCVSHYSF